MANFLALNTGPRETVFTFPDLGTYNFITDTQPVGRFHCAEFSFIDGDWFREMMLELEIQKPRFAICAKEFTRLQMFAPRLGVYTEEIKAYLDRNYRKVRSYTTVDILKIR